VINLEIKESDMVNLTQDFISCIKDALTSVLEENFANFARVDLIEFDTSKKLIFDIIFTDGTQFLKNENFYISKSSDIIEFINMINSTIKNAVSEKSFLYSGFKLDDHFEADRKVRITINFNDKDILITAHLG